MKLFRLNRVIVLSLILLLAACVPAAQPSVATPTAGALLLDVVSPQRTAAAGSEQVFDFKLVNTTDQPQRVVISLAHDAGERWRTSLCVGPQCLLGDGSETTAADPITLPPYLEQPFQAHLFVDAAAQAGQETALTLRVEPQSGDIASAAVTLHARVDTP